MIKINLFYFSYFTFTMFTGFKAHSHWRSTTNHCMTDALLACKSHDLLLQRQKTHQLNFITFEAHLIKNCYK